MRDRPHAAEIVLHNCPFETAARADRETVCSLHLGIAQGLAELGLTADAVSVEVLDAGTKGFFGLGKTQVRVRLVIQDA